MVVSINEEEETEMFPEGARFIQDINDVMKTFPEGTNNKVLRSAEKYQKERALAQE